MKHDFRKISVIALVGMMLTGGFAYDSVTVHAEGLTKQEQLTIVQDEHRIPYTDKAEKAIDGTFLSVTGFAGVEGQGGKVTDRTGYIDTEYYREVHTEEEFLDALQRAKSGEVKVIEICEDLYLGWNELSAAAKNYSFIHVFSNTDTYTGSPCSNPSFVEAGVSEMEIDNINGLTIFSQGGNKICHATIKLQAGVQDLVIRNLEFTDVWDWRDQRTKGFGTQGTGTYTKLPYLKINGAKNVWIDHCNFAVSYLGNTDLENGASGISITWCNIGGMDYSVGSMFYKTIAYLEELYQQNKNDPDVGVFKVYKIMRDNGMEKEDIAKYMSYENLAHMCGAGDADSWWINKLSDRDGNVPYATPDLMKTEANERIRITLAYNHWTNMGSRLPMIRGGVGHLVNCYTDNSSLAELQKILEAKDDPGSKSIQEQVAELNLSHVDASFLYRGQNARNGASIAADTCVYKGMKAPILGRESEVTKDQDSNYQLNTDGFTVFGYNHSLIVNSKVSQPGSATYYTGSSWDFDGVNEFTADNFIWNKDKATFGSWSWGKPKPAMTVNSMAWQGYRHDMADADNDGEVELPYSYQTFPLEDVEENVNKYAGAYTMDLTKEEWLKTTYTTADIPNIEAKLVDPEKEVPVEKIELSKGDAATLYIQEEFMQLDARVYPSDTTEKEADYIWTSSDQSVATVNDCGLVIPKSPGETTIMVTTSSGKTASCKVTVGNLPTKLKVVKPAGRVYVGDLFQMNTAFTPEDVLDSNVAWSTDSECVRLVDEEKGIFEAVAEGKSQSIYAMTQAKGNRVSSNFLSAGASVTISEEISYTPGDMVGNGDGVTLQDAQYALKMALHIVDGSELDAAQRKAADVVGYCDGTTLADVQAILKRVLKIQVVFDQEQTK